MKNDRASSTAYTVLQGMLFTSRREQFKHLVDPQIVTVGERMLSATGEGRKRLAQLDSWLFTTVLRIRERLTLPGISLHYVLRKRHIENIARKCIADGTTQVVMLGAGFDTLLYRLHIEHDDINFIEIDHPATQEQKMKLLKDDKHDNFHFLSVNFARQDLKSALSQFTHFDSGRKTLFICEGVIMYLSLNDIDGMFNSIRELSGSGTEFVFSALEPKGSDKNSVPDLLYWYLEKIDEPINWDLDSDNMELFLSERHCKMNSLAGRDDLVKEQLEGKLDIALHKGEYFVHCTFE